ncbi:MAG: hypothetical protein ACK5JJ_06970, partial [Cyanobacteriota bacterium]
LAQRPTGRIVLTGRDGHGRCRRLQEALGWPVLVQEQEAYLLPGMASLETFAEEHHPAPGRLGPLRHRRSFHWSRQLESVERLRRWLPAGSPEWVATGAGLGALRGEKLVAAASQMLRELDLEELRRASEAPLGAPSTMTDFL